MKDLKYLAAFSIPVVAFIGLSHFKGVYSYLTPFYAFIIIPVMELIFPINTENVAPEDVEKKLNKSVFDWLLYLNLPIVYGLTFFGLYTITHAALETYEFVGIIFSVGIVLGVNGINVAHELGHRQASKERFIGKALLLPALYMHFYIEHNFGHHLHAATKEDPATARYNQSVYSFWITSIIRQYFSAWSIQKRLLKNYKLPFISLRNDMFWFAVFQLSYLLLSIGFLEFYGFVFALSSGMLVLFF